MGKKTHALVIGLALVLPYAAHAVPVSLSIEAPIPTDSLKRALSLRGVTVVAQPEAAMWHVRVTHTHGDDAGALMLGFRHRHGASTSVRILPSQDMAKEMLVRTLALLIAERTSARSEPAAEAPTSPPTAARALPPLATPPHVAATVARSGTSLAQPSPWRLGLTAETAFLGVSAIRVGAMLSGGYQWGRWTFDLGAGGFWGINWEESLYLDGVETVWPTNVLPGTGFVGRLTVGFDLWRARHFTLAIGCAAEVDVSKPMVFVANATPITEFAVGANVLPSIEARIGSGRLRPVVRVGWRQPLVPVHVDFRVNGYPYEGEYWGEADLGVQGTFVVAVGAVFGGR
jgi:hypothetical protein